MNGNKLRGKMAEKRFSVTDLAGVLGMSVTSASLKLKDERFTVEEADNIGARLGLSDSEMIEIFFPKVNQPLSFTDEDAVHPDESEG